MRDGLREAVHQRRPLALEDVEHARRDGRVRAHEPRAGDERAEQRVGEPADPEERGVREQHLVGGVAAELVQVVEVPDQRAVRVDHALRIARRARGVHDGEPVAGADLRFHRLEDGGRERAAVLLERFAATNSDRVRRRSGEGDAAQHGQRLGEEGRRDREVELGHGARATPRRSRASGTTTRRAAARRRRSASSTRSSAAVENVLSGTATAPIRAAASQATTKSLPLGWRMPTRVSLPAPTARRPRASAAERRSASAYVESIAVAREQHGRAAALGPRAEQRGERERQPVARVDPRGRHAPLLRVDTGGSAASSPATALTSASQSTAPPASSRAVEVILPSATERSTSNASSVSERRRAPVADGERGGLAGDPDVAVVVLDDDVEEHGEEAAVDEPGRSLEDDREAHRPRRAIAVDADLVGREARVEGADVARVVEVDPALRAGRGADAGRRVGRHEARELGLGVAQRGGEAVERVVRRLEREHEPGDAADQRRDVERLWKRLHAERPAHSPPLTAPSASRGCAAR